MQVLKDRELQSKFKGNGLKRSGSGLWAQVYKVSAGFEAPIWIGIWKSRLKGNAGFEGSGVTATGIPLPSRELRQRCSSRVSTDGRQLCR
jgi:hypothetical protein